MNRRIETPLAAHRIIDDGDMLPCRALPTADRPSVGMNSSSDDYMPPKVWTWKQGELGPPRSRAPLMRRSCRRAVPPAALQRESKGLHPLQCSSLPVTKTA